MPLIRPQDDDAWLSRMSAGARELGGSTLSTASARSPNGTLCKIYLEYVITLYSLSLAYLKPGAATIVNMHRSVES